MNDVKDLKSLRDDWVQPDPPSQAAYSAARAALLQQIGVDAPPAPARGRRPGVRLGWLVGSTVLTGTLAAAVAFAVTTGSTPPVQTPSHTNVSGQQILLAAADVAQTRPADTGTYWHLAQIVPDAFDRPQRLDTWVSHDGTLYSMPEGNSGVLLIGLANGFQVGASTLTLEQLRDLPTDPDALRAWITDSFAHVTGPVAPPAPGDTSAPALAFKADIPAEAMPGTVAMALGKLLWDVPVSPAVRATALRALASMPNVTGLGRVDGGEALRISFPPPPADKYPGGKLPDGADHLTLVIDPATSMLVRFTNYQGSIQILGAEWTDEMPRVITS
jgi:hypothetical protein